MKLDIKKLKLSGKTKTNFFFLYEPEQKLTTTDGFSITNPVKVNGTVSLTGVHSAYVEGEIAFIVKGFCSRCLEQTEKEFVINFAEQVDDENENGYVVVNDIIDLDRIVDDGIIINIPVIFLCSDDCKGICSGCGVNLNKDTCKCK